MNVRSLSHVWQITSWPFYNSGHEEQSCQLMKLHYNENIPVVGDDVIWRCTDPSDSENITKPNVRTTWQIHLLVEVCLTTARWQWPGFPFQCPFSPEDRLRAEKSVPTGIHRWRQAKIKIYRERFFSSPSPYTHWAIHSVTQSTREINKIRRPGQRADDENWTVLVKIFNLCESRQ